MQSRADSFGIPILTFIVLCYTKPSLNDCLNICIKCQRNRINQESMIYSEWDAWEWSISLLRFLGFLEVFRIRFFTLSTFCSSLLKHDKNVEGFSKLHLVPRSSTVLIKAKHDFLTMRRDYSFQQGNHLTPLNPQFWCCLCCTFYAIQW